MILWVTDVHFDHLKDDDGAFKFGKYISKQNKDATCMIITGDISVSSYLTEHLTQLADGFGKPIYFVLGNHCHYGSSFDQVDKAVTYLCKSDNRLVWLNKKPASDNGIPIVGAGGWYDRRYGDEPRFQLLDYSEITDFKYISSIDNLLLETIRNKADYEAEILRRNMIKAAEKADEQESWSDTIIVCTHVSPYKESSWHLGRPSNQGDVGCFSSKASGDAIDQVSEKYSHKNFIVLCGHSHSPGIFKKRSNLIVFTGKAEYGNPSVAGKIYTKERKIRAYDNLKKKVDLEFDDMFRTMY